MNLFIGQQKIPDPVRKRAILRGALYALILICLFVGVEVTIYMIQLARITTESDNNHWGEIDGMTARLTSTLLRKESDFLIVGTSEMARDCLKSQTSDGCTSAISLMITAMKIDETIDHMRLINTIGREIARVNRTANGQIRIVSDGQLQDKSDRPYFKESLKTGAQQLYVSKIELNVENGQIEQPLKPIVRIGKAIRLETGSPMGCFVANYRVRNLIGRLDETLIHPEDNWYLLSSDGYYLHTDMKKKEFSFMYPNRRNQGFFSDFPTVWEKFKTHSQLSMMTDGGKFYLSSISLAKYGFKLSTSRHWILVLHVPPKFVMAGRKTLLQGLIAGALFLTPILAVLGWKTGNYYVKQKWFIDELATSATTDNLTRVLNHRGVMDRLESAVAIANRRGSPLTLVFVDVNDLKSTNDTLGHEIGDRLILGTAEVLRNAIRRTDIVGRLGGDEFVVALIDCDLVEAENVIKRAALQLAHRGIAEIGAPWTMSWGCAVRTGNDSAAQLLSRADQQMYSQKQAYKTGRFRISGFDEIQS